MKRIIQLVVLVSAMVVSIGAIASPKIAVINIQQALVTTERAKSLIAKLESEEDYAKAKSEISKLQSQLEKLNEEGMRDGPTWSPVQIEAAQKKMINKKADMDHLIRKIQTQNKELVQRMMNMMGPDIQGALQDIVEKEGITLLLERQFVMHVDATLDLTSQLTAKLNDILAK